jgi:hypothetical protein
VNRRAPGTVTEHLLDAAGYRQIDDADLLDEAARKGTLEEEFGLFSVLDDRAAKVEGVDSRPIDPPKIGEIGEEVGVNGSGVTIAHGPSSVVRIRPQNRGFQVSHQMNDWFLATAVMELRMIPLLNDKKQ